MQSPQPVGGEHHTAAVRSGTSCPCGGVNFSRLSRCERKASWGVSRSHVLCIGWFTRCVRS